MNSDELERLKQFKKSVADIHHKDYEDYFYIRWLRARNYDLEKAEIMLRESLEWRKELDIDNILTTYTPPEVASKYSGLNFIGYDKDGSKVAVVSLGNCDIKGILNSISEEEFDRFIFYSFEKNIEDMRARNRKTGHKEYQIFYIIDLSNFSLRHVLNAKVRNYLTYITHAMDSNYPDLIKGGVFINCSRLFSLAWAVLRPFMHDNTAKKFDALFGSDWREKLLELVDADVLPPEMGGNNEDCFGQNKPGGTVPSCYFKKSPKD